MAPGMLGKNRGGLTFRPYSGRPNVTSFPPPSYYCRQSRYDLSNSFYHGTQKNAKVHEMMFRLGQIAYEQLRRSGAALLRRRKQEERIKFLERHPLSTDVTLNIEVPFEDHFDMIAHTDAWCQEDSIARIMNDTGVLILFPCGRVDADGLVERVNTVKLKGPLAKVEEARRRLRMNFAPSFNIYNERKVDTYRTLKFAGRGKLYAPPECHIVGVYRLYSDLCPISVAIPLCGLKANMTVDAAKELIGMAIADKRINFPRLEITVMRKAPDGFFGYIWACVVRGSMCREDEICEACIALYALLFDDAKTDKNNIASLYTSSVDVPLSQQLSVLGIKGDLMVRLISNRTDALVCYPNVSNRRSDEPPFTILYFKGTVRAIMRARKYVQGLLPVQLSFDVDDDDLIERIDRGQRGFTRRDDVFGVNITVKASRIEGEQLTEDDFMRHLVVIESEEHNLANVYATRRALFRASALNEPVVVPKDYEFFDPLVRQLASANSKLIFERERCLEESTQMSSLAGAVCVPLTNSNDAVPLPLDHWQAGSLGNITLPLWNQPIPAPSKATSCRFMSALNPGSCPLHSHGVVQAYVMGDVNPNVPSNNSSVYSAVSSVMPPSVDSSSSRTMVPLSSTPAGSTGIVTVPPPVTTAHHFINSLGFSPTKQSVAPLSIPVAQFVDSFRTCSRSTQQCMSRACVSPTTHVDAPQLIQANILHLPAVRLPQPEPCCGLLPAGVFPPNAERLRPEREDRFELVSMGNASRTNVDSEVAATVHGMDPVIPVSPTPSGISVRPNSRNSSSQGCTTEAVAAAMLSNVPLQWPSSVQSNTPERPNECLGTAQQRSFVNRSPFPRFNQRTATVSSSASNRENTNYARRMINAHFSNEYRMTAKRTLPLKANFSGERLIGDESTSLQRNASNDALHKGCVELSSDVRLSPGGALSRARVGDFRTCSLNSMSPSQRIRDSRFSPRDFRNDPRDGRVGAPREYRNDLREQMRDFRGYRNELHEFGNDLHGSRNGLHEFGYESRVLRNGPRDVRNERRDCTNGSTDLAREPHDLRNEMKGAPFGRLSPRGTLPLSHAISSGRDSVATWNRSFHRDFPPPSVDSSAFRRDNFSRTPTFPFTRGLRRATRDGSSRGDAHRFCQPKTSTLPPAVHLRSGVSGRVGDASIVACSIMANRDSSHPFSQSCPPQPSNSSPYFCRDDGSARQLQERSPTEDEEESQETPIVKDATSPEGKEGDLSQSKKLDDDVEMNKSHESGGDSVHARGTTSSTAVGTALMKTYADIAKCVDAIRVTGAVRSDEGDQAVKNKESTDDSAQTAESVEKCGENTKPPKSYAEMTKKSVEQHSTVNSSTTRPVESPDSPNSKSSGSEIGSMKEKIEWTLANFDDVQKVLSRIGCQHLVPLFKIQMRDFCALSEDDLMRIGIKSSSERSRIHRAILRLRFAQHK